MKTRMQSLPALLALLVLSTINAQFSTCFAQGTAFTYQGRLNFNGAPAAGNFDFRFRVASDVNGNNFVGGALLANGVPVTNGLFLATVDFGAGVFNGGNLWLQIEVRTNGAAGYTTLNPLQPFTPTPYAVFATTAGNVSGTVSASQIGGTILNSTLPANPNFSGTVSANQISGNGANVTNVNAALVNGKSAANFWQTGGNAGTSPTNGNFLGTTDNQPLEFQVNGLRALRIEANTNSPNMIGGYPGNVVSNGYYGATIVGGGSAMFPNRVGNTFATVLGGDGNVASGDRSTAMGKSTTASGDYSTSMGFLSTASGFASIAGGGFAMATGSSSTAFGYHATASGGESLATGDSTTASGQYSTAMGESTTASGITSMAVGTDAKAVHDGTFVWADGTTFSGFSSTAPNQFLIRSTGGVGINTNAPVTGGLSVNGSITSPMWRVTSIINSSGALTKTGSFTSAGGTLMIFASGSGYSAISNINIGMDVKLDGVALDYCAVYANTALTHMAFVPKTIIKTGVAAGAHTISLVARSGVSTDASDNFCVTVQELPF